MGLKRQRYSGAVQVTRRMLETYLCIYVDQAVCKQFLMAGLQMLNFEFICPSWHQGLPPDWLNLPVLCIINCIASARSGVYENTKLNCHKTTLNCKGASCVLLSSGLSDIAVLLISHYTKEFYTKPSVKF